MADGFSTEVNLAAGTIYVIGSGFWSPAETEAHFIALETSLKTVRRQHGRVKALIDLRTAVVQSVETAKVIEDATARIYQPLDRVALVRASVLVSLQMQRAVSINITKTFATIEEALSWLDEPAQRTRTASR